MSPPERNHAQDGGQGGGLADRIHSHLIAIDADLDPLKLRVRHPDRTAVVIVPAAVGVTLEQVRHPGMKANPKDPARVTGRILQLPSAIHVPRPVSDDFRRLNKQHGEASNNNDLSYRVHLRYGAALEPWVTGVEFRTAR